MIVWFATGNIHKKKELSAILAEAIPRNGAARLPSEAFELKIPADAGLEFDPDETGNTFSDNALIKAGELHRLLEERRPPLYTSGDPVIADDSGICVDALGGRPGVYSARYCGPRGSGSPVAGAAGKLGDADRNLLLLEEFAALGAINPRRDARFVCAMVLYYNPGRFFVAQETLEGELVKGAQAARGTGGFGYDPILYIPELGRTVAELSDEEKNRHSHRGKAGRMIGRILSAASGAQM